jgi:hypothetical protein
LQQSLQFHYAAGTFVNVSDCHVNEPLQTKPTHGELVELRRRRVETRPEKHRLEGTTMTDIHGASRTLELSRKREVLLSEFANPIEPVHLVDLEGSVSLVTDACEVLVAEPTFDAAIEFCTACRVAWMFLSTDWVSDPNSCKDFAVRLDTVFDRGLDALSRVSGSTPEEVERLQLYSMSINFRRNAAGMLASGKGIDAVMTAHEQHLAEREAFAATITQ